jgi:DNA-binding MarR family transcriptional regulator
MAIIMAYTSTDEVIELLVTVPQMVHRRILRNVFRTVVNKVEGGLAEHHLRILRILKEAGPLHVTEIGRKIAISKPQMTHSANKLIDLGMIEREVDEKDRRKINIRLTSKGNETIRKIKQEIRRILKAKLSTLSVSDLGKLKESLINMADIFAKIKQ